jgi:ABC-type nitrate/sulfonate/bicarbonate transport system substrate-binding protein
VPDYYTPVIITNESLIAAQPDLVQAFVSATARGYEFAAGNPDEAAKILIKAVPESDPALIRASQKWLSSRYQADASQWGIQDQQVWQRYADWLAAQGVLEKTIGGQAAFSNKFLPPREN